MSTNTVYVFDTTGKPHAHGPARASRKQADSVARLLTKRLGWEVVVADETPADREPADRRPTATQAATSPIWKDAQLAQAWEASGKK